jgi:hypothetical protein
MAAASATGTCKGGIEAYRKLREYKHLDLDVVAVPRPSWALARPRRLRRASVAGGGLAGAAPRPGGVARAGLATSGGGSCARCRRAGGWCASVNAMLRLASSAAVGYGSAPTGQSAACSPLRWTRASTAAR